MDKDFSRIERLPRYVFEEINQLKIQARHDGKDIIDLAWEILIKLLLIL
jgi:alanine-synthesizing transaminase